MAGNVINSNIKYFLLKKKFFLMFIFVCLTFITALYSCPVVDDSKQIESNTRNIYLPFGFGFSVGSDAGNYMRIAKDPSIIFERDRIVNGRELVPGTVGLSRPGFLFTTYIVSKPIDFIFNYFDLFSEKIHKNLKKSLDSGYKEMGIKQTIEDSVPNLKDLYPTYITFVLLNLIIIILCFIFYGKAMNFSIFKISSYTKISLWLGFFFIINDLTKKYIVSPSVGLFNLLAVSITLLACSELKKETNNQNLLIFFSLIFGLGNLFYEIFICPFITLFLIYLKIEIIDKKKQLKDLIKNYKIFLSSIITFITPYLSWYIFVEFYKDGFYHFGIEASPGFSILSNDFLTIFSGIFLNMIHGIKIACLSVLPVFLLLLTFGVYSLLIKKDNFFKQNNFFLIGLIYSITILLFFSSYGVIASRHTVGILLIFIPFLATLIEKNLKKKNENYIYTFFVFFIFYSIYFARKTFPYGEGSNLFNPFT